MGHMRNSPLLTLSAICFSTAAWATHLCGADMRYTHIEGLTYQVEVRLYLNSQSPADVPELILSYGDGIMDTIPSSSDLALGSDCCDRLRTYIGEHTYSGLGVYIPSVIAPNRTAGMVNVPASVDTPICIGAMLLVSDGLTNSSPEFVNDAVFSYFNGSVLTHELQPYDVDGDSMAFELLEPNGEECVPIAGYQFPDEVVPGPYSISVSSSGVFQWNAPQLAGLYAIAIRCTEWRDGQMIGAVTRDMMLCVSPLFTAISPTAAHEEGVGVLSIDGHVSIRMKRYRDAMIDILDTRGTLLNRLRPTGPHSIFRMDGMTPGIYLVKAIDAVGAFTTGRFVVAR